VRKGYCSENNWAQKEGILTVKRRMNSLIRLTRYNEYPFFVIVTSLLGAAAGHGSLCWRLLGVLAA
jgi:hypothetical protein